jgi:branched chain amino acid efflux pump
MTATLAEVSASPSATLAAILAMAAITYATRVAGILLAGRLVLAGRAKAAFAAIPAAVLTAVIAPAVLATGWPESIAAAVTALAASRLPLLPTIVIGVAAVVGLRLLA